MHKNAKLALRIGLGLTFIFIGILIFFDPQQWLKLLSPWVLKIPVNTLLIGLFIISIFDILVGIMFLFNLWPIFTGILASVHLIFVLIVTGFNLVTIRDIGLLGAILAYTIEAKYFHKHKK